MLNKVSDPVCAKPNPSFNIFGKTKNMRKKIVLSCFVLGLAAASCKKSYTCNCIATASYTNNGAPASTNVSNSSRAYDKKLTKKQAQAACDHEALAIQSSAESFFQNPLVSPYFNVSVSTSCTLK
jgi:hypothetical protein